MFRSIQFTAYGTAYAASKDSPVLMNEIPGCGGLQYRVVVSGMFASTMRALLECPLELIKVRKQTGQAWMASSTAGEAIRAPAKELKNLYSGFGITWMRTLGLMTSFFVMTDSLERHRPDIVGIPMLGPFIKGGVCATLGWIVVWPFENVR
jgi:solute carrier family 25 carnitine/acylcarnitine transporter 20/29